MSARRRTSGSVAGGGRTAGFGSVVVSTGDGTPWGGATSKPGSSQGRAVSVSFGRRATVVIGPQSAAHWTTMTSSESVPAPDTNRAPRAKILTVSDGVIAGTRQDASGQALAELLEDRGWVIEDRRQVADGVETVAEALRAMTEGFSGLVVTTGGTGFGPRDLTPEGTRAVLEREAPGMAEVMRLCNDRGLGRLSRAVAGTRGRCLILNTPGSTGGAVETIESVLDVVPHAIELLAGQRPH